MKTYYRVFKLAQKPRAHTPYSNWCYLDEENYVHDIPIDVTTEGLHRVEVSFTIWNDRRNKVLRKTLNTTPWMNYTIEKPHPFTIRKF